MGLRAMCVLALAVALGACQPPASAPTKSQAPPAPATAAKTTTPEPVADDASIPAKWQEADGPGVTAIFVEDQGQRVALECSRSDSVAASAPGKVVATATWRDGETPPKAQDVSLNVAGANYDGAPLWSMDGQRAAVSITLDPTRALIATMQQPQAAVRMIAGDWFLPVAPDTSGALTRFAATCAQLTSPKQ